MINDSVLFIFLAVLFLAFLYLNDLRMQALEKSKDNGNRKFWQRLNIALIVFIAFIWINFYEVFDALKGTITSERGLLIFKVGALGVMLAALLAIKFVFKRNIYNKDF